MDRRGFGASGRRALVVMSVITNERDSLIRNAVDCFVCLPEHAVRVEFTGDVLCMHKRRLV